MSATNKPTIKPDLSHRLRHSEYDPGCHVQLSDAINNMVDRASGVLNLLSFSYTGMNDCQPSDETVFNTIESAIQELADIRATVGAFHEVQRAKTESESKTAQNQQTQKSPAL
ncbi:MAG: hypothetical protein Q8Q50_09265 [Methylobacter sp.]|nr:hypothetical protein [Methylobacter sp.]